MRSTRTKIGSQWKKVRESIGSNLCVGAPRTHVVDDEDGASTRVSIDQLSGIASPAAQGEQISNPPVAQGEQTSTPRAATGSGTRQSSKGMRKTSPKAFLTQSQLNCPICLQPMNQGDALFVAECTHVFHFECIANSVKHGNEICPVCRGLWRVMPSLHPTGLGRSRSAPEDRSYRDTAVIDRIPTRRNPPLGSVPIASPSHQETPVWRTEPEVFNDDQPLDQETVTPEQQSSSTESREDIDGSKTVQIETYTEVSSVPRARVIDDFTVCLHLKAPGLDLEHSTGAETFETSQMHHAPIDLVTLLDVSGSMCGTKLALLKQAMGFVIQNLGPKDRLSIITFNSIARRRFPLRRMSDDGRAFALEAVNKLGAVGGTNIGHALAKAAKVMEERAVSNPVACIMLLSDGQDTYNINNTYDSQEQPGRRKLLPQSIRPDEDSVFKVPIHSFGFGHDHDAVVLHMLSDTSGGTFSFIENQDLIQDAFAQCIGGLLSVVAKDLRVRVECVDEAIHLGSLKTGSYPNHTFSNRRAGSVDVGDLYADEERDFLVSVNVPAEPSNDETLLLKVMCLYTNPLKNESVTVESTEVKIKRTDKAREESISIQVDRQRNRIHAAEAMAEARIAAENRDLGLAVSKLENTRKALSETVSARANDGLSRALYAELKKMQERLASRPAYETSGRAYLLSGLSSHSSQRATARGDSTQRSSLVCSYQTPRMSEMITRSHESVPQHQSAQRPLQPTRSSAAQPIRRTPR